VKIWVPSGLGFIEIVLLVGVDVVEEAVLRWHRQQIHLRDLPLVFDDEGQAVVVHPVVVVLSVRVPFQRRSRIAAALRILTIVVVVGVGVVHGVIVVVIEDVGLMRAERAVVVVSEFSRRHLVESRQTCDGISAKLRRQSVAAKLL